MTRGPLARLVVIAVLAAGVPAVAAGPTADTAPPPLRLAADAASAPLAGHLEILEDPDGALGIAEVLGRDAAFRPAGDRAPNLGLSHSTWWVRFRVVLDEAGAGRALPEPVAWLLELAWPLTERAELYLPDAGVPVQRGGSALGRDGATLSRRNPTFALPLAPGRVTTGYLRLQSRNSQAVPLAIWSRDAWVAHEGRELLALGLLHGVLLLAVVAGLSFFVLLRDLTYLHYAVMVGCFGLWDAINAGLPAAYLWPAPFWSAQILHLAGVVGAFALAFFVRRFLSLDEHAPRLARIPWLALPALPVLLAWPLVGGLQSFVRVAIALLLFANAWTLCAAVLSLLHGQRSARYFLVAWSLLLAAIVPSALRGLGLAPTSFWSLHGLQLGIVLTSLTLWLGLADRLRRTTRSLQELNLSLEERIRQRTADLEATGRELARANDAKRDFLASASHDLRQPLHALNLQLGVLDGRLRDPGPREVFEQVKHSAQGVAEMLDALLDLSKLDAGVVEPQLEPFALRPLVAQLAGELRPVAERKGVALRAELDELAVRSDPLLLRRIVQNLLTNAIRYTDRGSVEIRCEATPGPTDDAGQVWIHVRDTGRGIPEAARRRIFEQYTRLDPAEPTSRDGLGLGLSIVQRLARLLEHPLEVHSTPGAGSTFSLCVPACDPRVAGVAKLRIDATPGGFDGARVLVLEPDTDARLGLRQLLEAWDCRVVAAGTLDEARAALAAEAGPPQALLLDADVAGAVGDGEEGLDALRGAVGDVPALVLSADSAAGSLAWAQQRGLVLLRKPVAPARFRAALAHLLGGGAKNGSTGSQRGG